MEIETLLPCFTVTNQVSDTFLEVPVNRADLQLYYQRQYHEQVQAILDNQYFKWTKEIKEFNTEECITAFVQAYTNYSAYRKAILAYFLNYEESIRKSEVLILNHARMSPTAITMTQKSCKRIPTTLL